jgi:hypothetical protein
LSGYDVPLSPTGAKGHVGGAARCSAAEPGAALGI